jgi:adenosine deaminase CECR1
MISKDGYENIPHRDWVLAFDQVQEEIKAELKRQGREDEFIGAKVSYFRPPLMIY